MINQIEQYIEANINPLDDVLTELIRQTHLRTTRPRMISGHIQGELLKILTLMQKPRRVLELGTFTGFSAICIAKGLTEGSVLHTVDNNDEVGEIASEFFQKSNVENRIVQHFGDALAIMATFTEAFDMVFIDADKRQYCDYYKLLFNNNLVKRGSLILADNVIWNGKILGEISENDKHSKAILDFNEMIKNDAKVEKVILPLRDGITLIYVK